MGSEMCIRDRLIPYGARIDFLPPEPIRKLLPKFGPRGVPGVFLGWHMHPGGKWSRDYKVAALADLDLTNPGRSKKMRVFRVREVLIPNDDNGYTFPLKEAADRAAGTIGKVAEDAVPEDVEEDPQREDDHGAPQPTPNTMPQVGREESTLPAPGPL